MTEPLTIQVQTETRGAVPGAEVRLAVQRLHSLLRVASEPVLYARIELAMSSDPAMPQPASAAVTVDLNGRLIRAHATGVTMRAAVDLAGDRLRVRLERAARNWAALRGTKAAGRGTA